ncbi:hypothetical protein CBR_g23985 [Chara braunii]|uniref:DDE Tnp4 domain-containing protein n=1 Tax=Chara braunii TaxID=69332 RepID=A0A388L5F3_CHABU|nr:hypothetical protein CBR_g23985 [Chara braunii]|eukprot:GBG77540.1 hypothetical protein CBR_g23985 [Chara braunii]
MARCSGRAKQNLIATVIVLGVALLDECRQLLEGVLALRGRQWMRTMIKGRCQRETLVLRTTDFAKLSGMSLLLILLQLPDVMLQSPRWWAMRRAPGLWKNLQIRDDADDDYCFRLLRMHHRTFNRLLDVVRPFLSRCVARFRSPLDPGQILAYAIHRWAHGGSYWHSSAAFGMGKTNGIRVVCDVTAAIIQCFPRVISFGDYAKRQRTMDAHARRGFPNCWGCIDCMHLYVDKPKNANGDDYCSGRTKCFSIVAQITFDDEMRVVDLNVGWAGTVHDARILWNSSLFRRAESGQLFVDDANDPFRHKRQQVNGVTRGYLPADGGYPTLPWIVRPYGPTNATPAMKNFDDSHSIVRSGAERGNSHLKLRFQMFHRPHISHSETVVDQFRAVCVLHNLLHDWGDRMDEELLRVWGQSLLPPPGQPPHTPPPRVPMTSAARHAVGEALRDAL